MPALIPLALELLSIGGPLLTNLAKKVAGDNGEAVAQAVVDTAESLTGQKGTAAVQALKQDPAILLQYQMHLMQYQSEMFQSEMKAESEVIIAEAKSESWLTRNWRPMTMVTFVGLVVAKWFGYTAPGISEALELELLTIIKYGLSGYVVGRSAEKVVPMLAGIFNKGGQQ